MTYDEYWYGDVWAIIPIYKAYKLKQEQTNFDLWLQGMYIYDAVGRLSPILHAFAKKGAKPQPYIKEPYQFGEKSIPEQEQIAENERLKSIMFFKNWAKTTEKKFKSQ